MEKFQLSHPQKRVLFTQLLYENKPLFNIGGYVIYRGGENVERLKDALKTVVKKMDCFSIRIIQTKDGYEQVFADEEPIVEEWVIGDEDVDFNHAVKEKANATLNTPFNLLNSSLYRIILFHFEDSVGYILCCHHIIFDGWSVNLFAEQVCLAYKNEQGKIFDYKEFIKYEQEYITSTRGIKDAAYWKGIIKRINIRENKENKEFLGSGHREEFILSAKDTQNLIAAGEKWSGVNNVLYACFILLDYIKSGNGTIAMSNYNRHGRQMRQIAGMFTNTLLISVKCNDTMTFEKLIRQTKRETAEALFHYQWPFDLMGIKNDEQIYSYNVNCYNMPMNFKLGDGEGRYTEVYSDTQDIPFQVVLNTWGDEWIISFDISDAIFHEGDGKAILSFIRDFLACIEEDPSRSIGEFVKIIYERELTRQRASFTDKIKNPVCLDERVKRITENTDPNKPCIFTEDRSISYKEFSELIFGAMAVIGKHEIKKGDRILLHLENGLSYLVYIFAALFKGVCFTPLDLKTPINQVKYIYDNAEASALLTETINANDEMIIMRPELIKGSAFQMDRISEDQAAYLLYTSGTTGKPKGVVISRGALATYLNWAEEQYGTAVSYLYSSPAFDLSLTMCLLPLTSGGALVVAENNHATLSNLIYHKEVNRVNALKATPSNLSILLQQDTSNLNLNYIICGGEELSTNLAKNLTDRFGKNCHIYNEYGPTECTIGCMCYQYDAENDFEKEVSIGKAAPETHVYILDKEKRLCNVNEAGELYLAGKQLSCGYWKRDAENAKAFLNNILGESILYKTGDYGRYLENGNIEYLGRIGRQCKVNGYRVELDSIERVLKAIPDVSNAAVWVANKKQDELLAAVETTMYTEKELFAFVAEKLPSYCVPYMFYIYETIPVTQNGKVDIKYLETYKKHEQNDNNKQVLEMVLREVLDYKGNIDDFNYFLAGGDSVHALRVITKVEASGYHLSLADLLNHPKFEEMASCMSQMQKQDQVLKKYKLPVHMQYFSDICEDFIKYRHFLTIHCGYRINRTVAYELNNKLRQGYPSLNALYQNEYILENDYSADPIWIDLKKENRTWKDAFSYPYDNDGLFRLFVFAAKNESWIVFDAHHILVDGFSWKNILDSSAVILGGGEIPKNNYMQLYKINDELELIYNKKKKKVQQYHCVSVSDMVKTKVDLFKLSDIIKEVTKKSKGGKEYQVYLDFNGREFIKQNHTKNIGCYSMILPADTEELKNRRKEPAISKKRIELKEELEIRVNFLGNLNTMLPPGMTLEVESIEASLQLCSAYGCMAEVTGMIWDKKLYLYCSWRSQEMTMNSAEQLLQDVMKQLRSSKEQIFWLSEEDEEAIFDEMF